MGDRLPDDAIVVRGGRNMPEDLQRGIKQHPSGPLGASVECGEGKTVEELASALPHGQIGVTTVSAIRAAGGDVVPTPGRTPYHATLTGLTPEDISRLLRPSLPNPAKKP